MSKPAALVGKGLAFGPWEDGVQTVYRIHAAAGPRLMVVVLGRRAAGEEIPTGGPGLTEPWPVDVGRMISIYMYPAAGLTDGPRWPAKVPREPLVDAHIRLPAPPGWEYVD